MFHQLHQKPKKKIDETRGSRFPGPGEPVLLDRW